MTDACATDATLRAFLDGALSVDELERFEAHVDGCERCNVRMLELAREHHTLAGAAPSGGLLGRGSSVGRFVVLDVLGRGAFGTVYAAYDPQLDRRLALKVLDAWSTSEAERVSLVAREARGLARVTHPNVVAVHDTGLIGGVAWVAMEFVAGLTLTRWLEVPRTTQAVLEAFAAAGRGLVAIHAAGLVHGDFRPDNVLVGDDGRVLVTDFGLSSFVDDVAPGEATPAHEVPERGGPTPAADQHAFCRSLQLALSKARGVTPRHVQRALARGLEADPARRFPSMAALLGALAPRRTWPLVAAGVAVVALASVGVARYRDRCVPDEAALATVWSPTQRTELEATFARVGKPWAVESGQLVLQAFDRWREAWLRTSLEACVSARTNELPLETELRRACLADSRREVATLAGALKEADGALVRRAQAAVLQLSPPARCSDGAALRSEPAPDEQARRTRLLALREDLVAARSLRDLGRLKEARQALETTLAAAREAQLPTLVARATFELGATLGRLGEHEQAVALLEEAVRTGVEARADEAAAHAAVLLVYEKGVALHREDVAQEVAGFAAALVARVNDGRLSAGLLVNRALLAEQAGRQDEAIALQQQAVEAFERVAPGSPGQANALQNLARLLVLTGHQAEAQPVAQHALSMLEATRGPNHPNVGVALTVLGMVAFDEGRVDDAVAAFTRARDIAAASLGPEHVEVASANELLAQLALAKGDVARAKELALLATKGPDCRQDLEPLLTLAQVQLTSGEAPDALARYDACPAPGDPHTRARRLFLAAQVPGRSAADRQAKLEEAKKLARKNSALLRQLEALGLGK